MFDILASKITGLFLDEVVFQSYEDLENLENRKLLKVGRRIVVRPEEGEEERYRVRSILGAEVMLYTKDGMQLIIDYSRGCPMRPE